MTRRRGTGAHSRPGPRLDRLAPAVLTRCARSGPAAQRGLRRGMMDTVKGRAQGGDDAREIDVDRWERLASSATPDLTMPTTPPAPTVAETALEQRGDGIADVERWARLVAPVTANDRFVYSRGVRRTLRREAVIGYLRVSTEEQAISGLGLADQRAVIEAAAALRGWDDISFISDEGHSARSLERPGVSSALDALARGEASVLVVAKLDRLSRSVQDFSMLMNRARREGWELVVVDLAIDTTTPSGALMANVMASFAEYERQLIGSRTSAALQQLKQQGVRLGRPRSMSSELLERIVGERARGATLAAIAAGLNDDGEPTARHGSKWYPSTVRAALRSAELDRVATS